MLKNKLLISFVALALGSSGLIRLAQIEGGTSANVPISDGTRLVSRTLSGDLTIGSTGVTTLKNTGTAGTYGDSTHTLTITTDAQGRVTSVTSNALNASPARDNFVGDGVTTTFTLGATYNLATIYLNGVLLTSGLTTGDSYTLTSTGNRTLTMKRDNATYTPDANDNISAFRW